MDADGRESFTRGCGRSADVGGESEGCQRCDMFGVVRQHVCVCREDGCNGGDAGGGHVAVVASIVVAALLV